MELTSYKNVYRSTISVRDMVEFFLRTGDIDSLSSDGAAFDVNAMQAGSKIHREIQKSKTSEYASEVPFKEEFTFKEGTFWNLFHFEGNGKESLMENEDEVVIQATVEGRADGVFSIRNEFFANSKRSGRCIDEIKSTYGNIYDMKEPLYAHKAQALCYAAMLVIKEHLPSVGVQLTYVEIDTGVKRYFQFWYSRLTILFWLDEVLFKMKRFMLFETKHKIERNQSLNELEFPFEYREGQRDLVGAVYRTIVRDKRLFLEAPTGVGKTISTIFPTVKAMGLSKVDKIFYLTAKTITRTVAEDTFKILSNHGADLRYITLTSKEKICAIQTPDCNPKSCPRAKGHYDRVNEAILDLLTNEERIDRDKVEEYALKHMVCPFEMSLDVSLFADAIVCDYNYAFDPSVRLKRYFADAIKKPFVFLIDEAHNLLERSKEMFSAEISVRTLAELRRELENYLEDYYGYTKRKKKKNNEIECNDEKDNDANSLNEDTTLPAVQISLPGMEEPDRMKSEERAKNVKSALISLTKSLQNTGRALFHIHKEHPTFSVLDSIDELSDQMAILGMKFDQYMEIKRDFPIGLKDKILDVFFNVRFFNLVCEGITDEYRIYSEPQKNGDFIVKLFCIEPKNKLQETLDLVKSTIFFSATLLPVNYYKEQLGGREDDYCVYAPTTFKNENRFIAIGSGVSTKYTRRTDNEYDRIAKYIISLFLSKNGNYIAFFPSYEMMEKIYEKISGNEDIEVLMQKNSMTEKEREDFLKAFEDNEKAKLGLCVMGGIFGEGIDLTGDKLIGAAIVGTGLPMVTCERELLKTYFDNKYGRGFDYAYRFPGMNKVMQAAGRVIRTEKDRGVVLLLDDRFKSEEYRSLFPREWSDCKIINIDNLNHSVADFWRNNVDMD
ncbi:MAG: ATP-dependent DNA helicase [Lachnospiraceae bacterium]|nr:ATP-dependent DNA helicase [Lachnospiraceae bacterium]